jgi:predicted nucleic acid-binding protein
VILVDTNVFIEILQGKPEGRRAAEAMEKSDPDEKFAYSVITRFELCARPQQKEAARLLLSGFEPVALTPPIAEEAAELFERHLSSNRRHIPDALIGATALALDAALWTRNRSDFKRVPRLRLNVDDNEYFRARLTALVPEPPPTKPSHRLLDSAFAEARAQVQSVELENK